MSILIALLACSGVELPTPSTDKPASSFREPGSPAPVRLVELLDTADLELTTQGNFPYPIFGRIPLEDWDVGAESTHTWPLPLSKKGRKKAYSTAPDGTQLFLGDERVEFNRRATKGEASWKLDGDEIVLRHGDTAQASFQSDALMDTWKRLDPEKAQLPPAEFVRWELSIEGREGEITRPGLALPAPSSISWPLVVPEGARLETSGALVPTGLDDEPGAHASLTVLVNGQEQASVSVDVDRFRPLTVDLSPWAGQEITLTLASETEGEADWDYVFASDPLVFGPASSSPRRVLVVGIDTLRPDAFTQSGHPEDVSAVLDPFAESAVLFDNAWAPAPRTRPSFRSSITGAMPMRAITAPTVGETFQKAGFTTAGVTANVHLVPRHGFNDGFDFWQFQNSEDADIQMGRASDWFEANQDHDSFLFMHLMDPHNFYRAPGLWGNKYVDHEKGPLSVELNRWQVLRLKGLTDENKAWLRDRYDGEVAWMADQLSAFLAQVLAMPGETLIVLHSDHGEEFWDHGSYEHNHTLYSEVTQANLWIRPPSGWGGGPHRIAAPVSLTDIAPTLYDMAGIDPAIWADEVDGRSLAPLLDADLGDPERLLRELHERPLQLGHLMYDRELWGVVADGMKYILRTDDGHEELYDLAADPREQDDLAAELSDEERSARLEDLAAASGFPAGLGWRVKMNKPEPMVLVFDQPVDAQVMEPDAASSRRHNVELGDLPPHWPEDVGSVEIVQLDLTPEESEDPVLVWELRFTPGTLGTGTLFVLPTDPSAGATLRVGDLEARLSGERQELKLGGADLDIHPGPLLLVRDSVRERMAADSPDGGGASESMLDALRELGYVE